MPSKRARKWSGLVTQKSDALDIEGGIFASIDPHEIAVSLKKSAEKSQWSGSPGLEAPIRNAARLSMDPFGTAGGSKEKPMARVYNFSSRPSMLPAPVLERAQAELHMAGAAPIGPTPGILARRRLHSSALCQAMSLESTSAICACSLRIFCREQLASQDGHVLISLNAIEQRIDVRHPPGGGKAELVAASRPGKATRRLRRSSKWR